STVERWDVNGNKGTAASRVIDSILTSGERVGRPIREDGARNAAAILSREDPFAREKTARLGSPDANQYKSIRASGRESACSPCTVDRFDGGGDGARVGGTRDRDRNRIQNQGQGQGRRQ